MGQVVLPLKKFWSATPVEFDEPLTLNGQPAGTISGVAQIIVDDGSGGGSSSGRAGPGAGAGDGLADSNDEQKIVPQPKGCCAIS